MTCRRITVILCAMSVIAFCTDALPNTIDRITNPKLKSYTVRDVERGAPSFEVSSRVLYREAITLLERGNREAARQKLLLAASLSGNYPDPMFTLARLDALSADPNFLTYLIEGFKRLSLNFHSQSLLAANAAVLIVTSTLGTLVVALIILLIKYWPLLDHWLRERYSRRFSFPPARWIGFLILVALLIMRLGFALYLAILFIILWSFLNRKEKAVIFTMFVLLSAFSYLASYSNTFVAALDPESVTRRLSMINEKGADERLLVRISEIDEPEYRAERDYAIGTLMYRLGSLEEAKAYLLNSVSRRNDFAPAYLNLGNVYFKQGDYDKALAGYQNVIAIDTTNVLAFYNIGQTYINKMLFAESSYALKKANELGIERYRTLNPSTQIKNLTIYDEGFGNADLWAIALREGKKRNGVYLSEILQPYLIFPFHRLWILLVTGIIAAIIIGKRAPSIWKVFRCDNCGRAICTRCTDTEIGLDLCPSCSKLIYGLTSVKVMEALLRYRRQKVSYKANRMNRWRIIFAPGSSYFFYGRTLKGIIITLINIGALLTLLWGGYYCKDPRALNISIPIWKYILPLVVLAAGHLFSMKVKAPVEPRNYRILPPDMRVETGGEDKVGRQTESKIRPDPEEKQQPLGTFLDSL